MKKKSKGTCMAPPTGFQKTIGSAAEVMHGTAHHTAAGRAYTKDKFMYNKNGHIVTKKSHAAGLKAIKRLRASGKMAPPFRRKSKSRSSRGR